MERPLILVGGGGHCRSVIDVAEKAGRRIMGILDLPEFVGTECLGYEVIGTDDDIPKFVDECDFLVTLGFIKSPVKRIELHRRILEAGGRLATLVSPLAHLSLHAEVGQGTVVMHFVSVNASARVGEGCILNTFANIEHDSIVGDFCHISTGAMVNGDCEVGEASFVGSGAVLYNGVKIAPNTLIGGGAVVYRTLTTAGTYLGNPCRKIKNE